MSYLDYDLGYEAGYETSTPTTRRPSRNFTRFAPEGSQVSYQMTGDVLRPRLPLPEPDLTDPILRQWITGGSETGSTPRSETPSRDASPAAPAPAATPTPPVAGTTDGADAPAVEPPTPQAPGAARARRTTASPIRSHLPSFSAEESGTLGRLDSAGIDAAEFYRVVSAPRGRTERAEFYSQIRSSSSDELRGRFHEALENQYNRYFRQQGVSEEVGQEYLRARGLIDDEGNRPELSSDDLNRHAEDLQTMRAEGLGARGGRDARVSEATSRISMTEGWIQAQQPGWNRSQAVAALEQMNPPLMENGRVTDFELAEGASALYRVADGSVSPWSAEGELNPLARPISHTAATGAEAIQAAHTQAESRNTGLDGIHSQMESLGLNSEERNAILGAQTALGGPIVDENGDLRSSVTPRQLELYGQALEEQMGSIEDLDTEADRRQTQLDRGGFSESRRTALQERITSARDRAQEARGELAQELRGGAAEFYRSQMPEHLRQIGLNEEQSIQWLNGRGHLSDRPDLARMASDFHHLSSQRGSTLRDELRREIQTNEGGTYVRPRGESPEAGRAEGIAQSFGGRGSAARGGRGRQDEPFASSREGVELQGRQQRELADAQADSQARMTDIQHRNQLELAELQEDFQREMSVVQFGQQMTQASFQGLQQMMGQTLGQIQQAAFGTSQQIFQGTAQMLPRAPDASQWYGNASGQPGRAA